MVFDRDDRMLQVGRDAVQRNVEAMLLEREPGLAVCTVEVGLADASRELVDRNRVSSDPDRRDNREGPEPDERTPQEVFTEGLWPPHNPILRLCGFSRDAF